MTYRQADRQARKGVKGVVEARVRDARSPSPHCLLLYSSTLIPHLGPPVARAGIGDGDGSGGQLAEVIHGEEEALGDTLWHGHVINRGDPMRWVH